MYGFPDADDITQSSITTRPIVAAIKEFYGSSPQLSQFMDQANPLAGLTHKRVVSSALAPVGLAGQSGSSRRTIVAHGRPVTSTTRTTSSA